MYETMWWVYTNDGRRVGEFGVMMSDEDFETGNYGLVEKTFNLWCWQNNLSAEEYNYCTAGK